MKENSIEEDIKIIEKYLSHFKKVCSPEMLKKDEIIKVIQYKEIQALQHILSNYKKALKENEELKKYIMLAPNLDEMTAIKYRNIQKEAYIRGRAEEQKKAEQIICENYISVQKLKNKIEKEELPIAIVGGRKNKKTLEYGIKLGRRQAIQELLESEE